MRDLSAAVDAILARTEATRVAILGWATGGHWAGMYAAFEPDKVSKLVFYNMLHGYTATPLNIRESAVVQAFEYAANPAFWLKLVLINMAGLNAALLHLERFPLSCMLCGILLR